MSAIDLTTKIRQLRELQALIEEAEQEAEAIKDAIKAHMGDSEELRSGERDFPVRWIFHGHSADFPWKIHRISVGLSKGQIRRRVRLCASLDYLQNNPAPN